MKLHWEDDESTAYWAQRWTLPVRLALQSQYDGSNVRFTEATWLKHIRQPRFPTYCFDATHRYLLPNPHTIILCFQHEQYLEGLALVVAWGGMTRTKRHIYVQPLDGIEQALRTCVLMTRHHATMQHAWHILVHRLQWSSIITSKVLHFLARSLDIVDDPPVPFDNKVIADQVWPRFQAASRAIRQVNDPALPMPWIDAQSSWQAYNRYMTAIRWWAHAKGWTTTQFENTIFEDYYPKSTTTDVPANTAL